MLNETTIATIDEVARSGDLQISSQEIMFLAAMGAIATVSGLSRAYRDSDYDSIGQLVALGITCGANGVAACGLLGYMFGDLAGREYLLLFSAITAGIIGKPLEKIMRRRFEKILHADEEVS